MNAKSTRYIIYIVITIISYLVVGLATIWAINGATKAEIQSVAGAALMTYPFVVAMPCIVAIIGSIFSIINAQIMSRRVLGVCLLILSILTPAISFVILFTITIGLPAA